MTLAALDRRGESRAVGSDFASAHRENGGNLCLSHCPLLLARQSVSSGSSSPRGGPLVEESGEEGSYLGRTERRQKEKKGRGKRKKGKEQKKSYKIQNRPEQKEAKRAVIVCRQGLNAVPESRKASLRPAKGEKCS